MVVGFTTTTITITPPMWLFENQTFSPNSEEQIKSIRC